MSRPVPPSPVPPVCWRSKTDKGKRAFPHWAISPLLTVITPTASLPGNAGDCTWDHRLCAPPSSVQTVAGVSFCISLEINSLQQKHFSIRVPLTCRCRGLHLGTLACKKACALALSQLALPASFTPAVARMSSIKSCFSQHLVPTSSGLPQCRLVHLDARQSALRSHLAKPPLLKGHRGSVCLPSKSNQASKARTTLGTAKPGCTAAWATELGSPICWCIYPEATRSGDWHWSVCLCLSVCKYGPRRGRYWSLPGRHTVVLLHSWAVFRLVAL